MISDQISLLAGNRATAFSYTASHATLILEFVSGAARYQLACAMCSELRFRWNWISQGLQISSSDIGLVVTDGECLEIRCEEICLWKLVFRSDDNVFEKEAVFRKQHVPRNSHGTPGAPGESN